MNEGDDATAGARRRAHLAATRVYVVATIEAGDEARLAALERALAGGHVGAVQFRAKRTMGATRLAIAREVARLARAHGALLLVNDDPALALELDADGVHVGEDDVPAEEARRLVGPHRLLGVSTHGRRSLLRALDGPADHAGLGPCFPSRTKDLVRTPGGALLAASVRGLAPASFPVFGIGGIAVADVRYLAAAGLRAVAVGEAVLAAPDPAAAAEAIARALPVDG